MKPMLFSKIIRLLLIFFGVPCIAGCSFLVASAVVGGAYTYHQGELTRGYQTAYDDSVQASNKALKALDIRKTGQSDDPLQTVIKGEYFNGKPVTITVSRTDPAITDISVRSGFVGFWDKAFSERIHEEIQKALQPS